MRMELYQEGVNDSHATIKVFDDVGGLVAEVIARVDSLKGGDGGLYPAVALAVKESKIETKFVRC